MPAMSSGPFWRDMDWLNAAIAEKVTAGTTL